MFIIKGAFNEAKVFTDVVEQTAIDQIKTLCDQDFIQGSKIRIMPDVHAGKGCTIGTTMTIDDIIIPNLVGVDIGCGMSVYSLGKTPIDFKRLDDVIRANVPSGRNVNQDPIYPKSTYSILSGMLCKDHIDIPYALKSIGTLGGGNHFIEVDKDSDGNNYLVIHTGSRRLGVEVARHYSSLAKKDVEAFQTHQIKKSIDGLVYEMVETGKSYDITSKIAKLKESMKIPSGLEYLYSGDMMSYIIDVDTTQRFARLNREAIAYRISEAFDCKPQFMFESVHNYVDLPKQIIRKGAIDAEKGKMCIIPLNMRDGSLICVGKGNPDWNYSAPHGAGRIMSRAQAKKTLNMNQYTEEMKGIFSTSVNKDTLDESPMAYKSKQDIINNIEDTVEIIKTIVPVYNFKAAESLSI